MATLTTRSATIFIASGEETKVYRSVEEVPPDLRRRLLETTRSVNSATILIADKRGREELLRALQNRQGEKQRTPADAMDLVGQNEPSLRPSRFASLRSPWVWLEFLLPLAIGASLWFMLDSHF